MQLLIILIIIVGSVILHELSHGLVAYLLGDDTAKNAGRLSFNLIKHIDPYMSILVPVVLYLMNAPVFGGAKPVPVNYSNLKGREWGMALVAFSGPFTNFLLAFIFFLIGYFTGLVRFLPGVGVYYAPDSLISFALAKATIVNLGFMIFNLIPIPPLDGSRILYAIAPDGVRAFLASMERYGFIIVYILIFIFAEIFSNIMLGGINGILNFFYFIIGK